MNKTIQNRKGQATIELMIVVNILLLVFFSMIVFGVYIYDRMVCIYAVNLALNEAIGIAPDTATTTQQIEDNMRAQINYAFKFGLFMKPDLGYVKAEIRPDLTGTFSAEVKGIVSIKMPFVEWVNQNEVIQHRGEVDFAW